MNRELLDIHRKLESFIKKYYRNKIIRGSLWFSIVFLLFYLFLVFSEYVGHFSIVTRTSLFFGALLLLLFTFSYWLVKPILSYYKIGSTISEFQANEILQDHFPELKDQLKNVLELEAMKSSNYSAELIGKAILQKSEKIRVIPFKQAIKIKANFRYLKLVGFPMSILLFLYFYSPNVLSEGTERLINYNKYYEKPSAFSFIIENDSLSVRRGENLKLRIHTKGEYIPYPIFVEYGGVEYLLQKKSDNLFTYEFKTINQSFRFILKAEDYNSRAHDVRVLPSPQIINFFINISPPKYTNLPKIELKNNGDFIVPEGSEVEWNFKTKDIDKLWFELDKDSIIDLTTNSSNFFKKNIKLNKDIKYSVGVSNRVFVEKGILKYKAQIIPDEYPSINVQYVMDSLNPTVFYYRGQLSDDYGISKINFCYQLEDEQQATVSSLPMDSKDALQEFFHSFDFKEVAKQGKALSYYFEVWDNDAIHGPKKSRSQQFQFYLPSKKEVEEMENTNSQSMKDKLEKTQELAQELQKDVKNLKRDLVDKEADSWKINKKLSQISEKQSQLEQLMEEVAKENKKNNELLKNLSKEDQKLLEKQKQIEDLLSQLMDEEMKKLMEEINKLMEEFNKDEFNKLTEEMEMSYDDLSEQLDRNLEQLKRYEVEKKMLQSIDELKELAKEHKELSEETKKGSKSEKELQKKQAEHQQKMDDIAKKVEESLKKNKELEDPMNLDDMSEQMEQTKSGMQESSESLEKGKSGKASKQQKQSAEQMEQMAMQMQKMMDSAMQQQQEQDMESLRQIIENLNTFSFEQEELMLNFRGLRYKDPKYIQLFNRQTKESNNFDLIKDSLYALAKTQPMLAAPINKELLNIERELKKTEEALDNRQAGKAQSSQQMVMMSANNLSLLLSEVLSQMQNQQSQSQCKKSGNCNKPGGGKPKPGFGEAKKQAQSMKQQMQDMLQQLKDGKGSKGGKKKTNGQLGKMIAEQEKMQKMLSDLANSQGISPETAKKLKEIKNMSEQVENDLIQQNVTPSTLKRQELILTRLLEAENSEFKREQDNKRESNSAINPKISNPKDIFEYKEEGQWGNDMLIKNKVKLSPFYKNKYKSYILNINE